MKITTDDVFNYCNDNQAIYLVHGTTTDNVDSFIQDGLAINPNNISRPTVLFWRSGMSQEGDRITDYTWDEPHSYNSNTTACCVIFEVPKEILTTIKTEGKELNQENIFKKICREKVMTVPDCEFTREAYIKMQQNEHFETSNDDPFIFNNNPTYGPKYCSYGAEPNSPFIGFGVPPEYILAITDNKQVYYASNKLKNYISERYGLNISFPTEPPKSEGNINQQYIEALINFNKNHQQESNCQDQDAWPDSKFPFDGCGVDGM